MRIQELKLATTCSLTALADFYAKLLDHAPIEQTDEKLVLQVGSSLLTFNYVQSDVAMRYHFAINIPENQFDLAKEWITSYVPLIQSDSGEDTFYSENWDADILYFYEPAGNILELIARHTLENASDADFSSQSLLNISEIGIASDDVAAQVRDIQTRTGETLYRWSGNPAFTPVGDEHGLFIVVERGRIWFPDTGVAAEHLPVTAVVENDGRATTLTFP